MEYKNRSSFGFKFNGRLVTLTALMLALFMVASIMSGCSKDKKPDDELGDDTGIKIETSAVSDNTNELKEAIKVSVDALGKALSEHLFLGKDFIFEVNHNQSIELDDSGSGRYISKDTWIYTGVLNKTNVNRTISGDTAEFSASITFESNNTFPSNMSFDLAGMNQADHSNLTQWAYQILGEIVPVNLASRVQNAPTGKLNENIYDEDGITASVYKEIGVRESDSANTTTISLVCKNKNSESSNDSIEYFIVSGGSSLGIYKFTIFDYGSTLSNMESRAAGIFGKGTVAKLNTLSISDYTGVNDSRDTSYIVVDLTNEKCDPFKMTLMTDTRHISAFERKEVIYAETKTLPIESLEKVYKTVESILSGLFYCKSDFSDVNDLMSVEKTIEKEGSYGFPIKVSVNIEKTGSSPSDTSYIASIVARTAD